jgi:hypothetical protein
MRQKKNGKTFLSLAISKIQEDKTKKLIIFESALAKIILKKKKIGRGIIGLSYKNTLSVELS